MSGIVRSFGLNGYPARPTTSSPPVSPIFFRSGDAKAVLRYEDYTTDAAAWAVTQSGAQLKMFAVEEARSFAHAGRLMLASDRAVGLAANFSENVIEAVCDAATPVTLRLFTGAKPSRVLSEGREMAINYNQAEAMISLLVPAGRHQLKIVLR